MILLKLLTLKQHIDIERGQHMICLFKFNAQRQYRVWNSRYQRSPPPTFTHQFLIHKRGMDGQTSRLLIDVNQLHDLRNQTSSTAWEIKQAPWLEKGQSSPFCDRNLLHFPVLAEHASYVSPLYNQKSLVLWSRDFLWLYRGLTYYWWSLSQDRLIEDWWIVSKVKQLGWKSTERMIG